MNEKVAREVLKSKLTVREREWLCPLLNQMCKTACRSYAKPAIVQEDTDDPNSFIIIDGDCINRLVVGG